MAGKRDANRVVVAQAETNDSNRTPTPWKVDPTTKRVLVDLDAQGDTGATGVKGDTGNTGVKGDTGSSGVKGDTGTAGAKGDTGNQGDTGATGSQGTKGDTGTTGVKGDTGTAGSKGDTGTAGVKGDTGNQGDTGITGSQGTKGDTGSAGTKGDTGTQGDTGASGVKGDTGSQGDTGVTGSTGAKGDTGTAGAKGDTGSTGAKGDTGVKPAGQLFLTAAGMWPSTTTGAAVNSKREYTTNDEDLYELAFDTSTQEFAQITVAMPSDWNAGTITAVFYWTHQATVTNFGVVWQIEGRAYANDDAIDAAWGTLQEIADTGGTTGDLYISGATPAVTIAGSPAASQLVQFRIGRQPADVSDTMAIDALLLGVMINYTRT